MTRRTPLAAAALALLAAGVAAADRPAAPQTAPAPRPATSEPVDLLYLSDARPVVVRLRVSTDGRPLSEGWDAFVDALFARLDADNGGTLDATEAARLKPAVTLLSGRVGIDPPDVGVPLSRAAVAAFLRKNDLGPFRVPPGADPNLMARQPRIVRGGVTTTTEDLDRGLMDLLDADKNGKLSRAELAAAAEILLRLDADENEMLTADEVLRRPPPAPFFVQINDNGAGPAFGAEFARLARSGPDPALARRLLFRYGTPPVMNRNLNNFDQPFSRSQPVQPAKPAKRRLGPQDLKLPADVFAALDQDGDGELDVEELAHYAANTAPEIELALRFGRSPAGRPLEVLAGGDAPVTAFAAGPDVALEVPGVRLDLTVGDRPRDFRADYENRFRALDRDGNGYLDETEARNDPVLRDLFAALDRDGDGKLFEAEFAAALAEVEPVAAAADRGLVGTEVAEAGRGLFGLIDRDGDNRLSVRELKAMPGLVDRFDRDKDGQLAPGEVPRRFRVAFARGPVVAANPFDRTRVRGGMDDQPTPRPPVGPTWFRKMDRNRDGDVSRREFLGTDAEFRRLDADGDGLIDPDEAAAATSADR